jgi:hypothetical protein
MLPKIPPPSSRLPPFKLRPTLKGKRSMVISTSFVVGENTLPRFPEEAHDKSSIPLSLQTQFLLTTHLSYVLLRVFTRL